MTLKGLSSEESEELLHALRLRWFQERTDRELIDRLGEKISEAGTREHGWDPGVWDRQKSNRVRVVVKAPG